DFLSVVLFFFFFAAERSVVKRLDFLSVVLFFFFFAAVRSVVTRLDFLSVVLFFFFFAAERSVALRLDFLSVEFFFFFFSVSSSLLTMPLTAEVANAGRLTEVRKPSATAIAVILRIVFTLFGSIHFWRELTAFLSRGFSSELLPTLRPLNSGWENWRQIKNRK